MLPAGDAVTGATVLDEGSAKQATTAEPNPPARQHFTHLRRPRTWASAPGTRAAAGGSSQGRENPAALIRQTAVPTGAGMSLTRTAKFCPGCGLPRRCGNVP